MIDDSISSCSTEPVSKEHQPALLQVLRDYTQQLLDSGGFKRDWHVRLPQVRHEMSYCGTYRIKTSPEIRDI